MITNIFSSKDPSEVEFFYFDYADLLSSSETISSATVTSEVVSGVDPDPSVMIAGVTSISGSRSGSKGYGWYRW